MSGLQLSITAMVLATAIQIEAFWSAPILGRAKLSLNMSPPFDTALAYQQLQDFTSTMPSLPTLNIPEVQPLDGNWYTESTGLRGKMVYDDFQTEYTLVSAGSDWPAMDTLSETESNNHRVGPFSPIRKAAKWAMNLRRGRDLDV